MLKSYQEPEFKVVMQDAAGSVFFASSVEPATVNSFQSPAATLGVQSTNTWF